jgi:hypothetical protein
MVLISHRGNMGEPNSEMENHPTQINNAIKMGYNVEVDVWSIDDKFFLGHDKPLYQVFESFLLNQFLWIHTKNIEALNRLRYRTNCFFHNTDDAVLTSKNYIWVYPGKELVPGCIAVLPETAEYKKKDLKACYGICTDKPAYWIEELS